MAWLKIRIVRSAGTTVRAPKSLTASYVQVTRPVTARSNVTGFPSHPVTSNCKAMLVVAKQSDPVKVGLIVPTADVQASQAAVPLKAAFPLFTLIDAPLFCVTTPPR